MNPKELQRWERIRSRFIETLPLRIQNDLIEISPPKFDEPIIWSTFLHGPVGSGKTTQALFMLLEEMKQQFITHELVSDKYIFISVPELLFQIKQTYNKTNSMTEEEIIEKYSEADFLILDDFGVERTTDWSFQLLYIIINRRYDNMKKTVFTSNFSLGELAERLGDERLTSRIQHMCVIKKFNGDYRI